MVEAAVERYPGIVAIVITGYGTVKDAVDAIKRGASDFIAKPFQFDELMPPPPSGARTVSNFPPENAYLRSQLEERYQFEGILGRSRPMQALFHLLETVAHSSSTILVTGETGTGKEMVARAIHHNSPRRANRFVALNCSAIPETLLEAELFGHVRGAFTGAVGTRQGRFEQAHKGTLFLDEVGMMSAALQMKVLRALQEREFERVGDNQTIKVDVRVIAATNSDLLRMVTEGTFREDLYYRLNVIPVELPPLRDRRDDIPILVKHFLDKFAPEGTIQVSQSAMRALMAFHWPGNVRQLENAVERAVALGPGRQEIDSADLPPEVQGTPQEMPAPFVEFPEEGLDLPRHPRLGRTRSGPSGAGSHTRKPQQGRGLAAYQAHDAGRKTAANRSGTANAPTLRLLDDHRRRSADGVSHDRARRTAADVQAHQAEAPGRGNEVLRDGPALAITGGGAGGGRGPACGRGPSGEATAAGTSRGRDWRPGGEHRDPRQKFKDAKKERNQEWRKNRFDRRQKSASAQRKPRRGPQAGNTGRPSMA